MKKKTVLALVVILCFSFLCACGDSQAKPQAGDDLSLIYTSDSPEMEGYDCIIVQHENSDDVGYTLSAQNPFGYLQGTSFADEVWNRFKLIEDQTGCKVSLQSTAADYNTMATEIASGNGTGELLFSASVQVVQQFARSGALLPIDELGVIDFNQTEKYGSPNILEVTAYNGHPYAVSTLLWPLRQARVISVFMIDTNLTSTYNLTNPHEYLETQTWSWDGVEEIMRTYHIKEGDFELKALGTRSLDFLKLAVFGNGVELIKKDSDGHYITNVGDSNMVEAVQWGSDIYMNYKDAFAQSAPTPDWKQIEEDFIARTSIAALIPTSIIYNTMIYEVEKYSIVPFPTGPHGTYGEWPGVLEAADTFGVLRSADEETFAAKVLSILVEPFDSIPDYNSLVDYYAANVFFSREDAEIILGISKNAQYSYWPFDGADTVFWRTFTNSIYNGKAVTAMQKNVEKFELFIEENMIPNRPVYDLVG